jgi:LexA-binding, inner membrane-associated putative hydrolase
MMGTTHLTTGVTSAAATATGLAALGVPPAVCVLAMPLGAYSTLFPDWDHHGSRITWSLPPLSNFVSWVLRGAPFGFTLPPIVVPLVGWVLFRGWAFRVRFLPWHVRHRYETHTKTAAVLFGLVLGLPLWWLPAPIGPYWWAFAIAITVGCLTHRWGDMRTTDGLPNGRHGYRTIGRTFDVGSDHEYWLRDIIYRPCAIVSTVAALFLVSWLATP